MLDFVTPRLVDRQAVREVVQQSQGYGNDLCFTSIYLLQEKYNITVCFHEGFLFRHYEGNHRLTGYGFPIGIGNLCKAIASIEEDAQSRNRTLRYCLLTKEQMDYLESESPNRFLFQTDPGDSDYIYSRDTFVQLAGRALHRKRNYLARFEKEYPDWSFKTMTEENISDALFVAESWYKAHEGWKDWHLTMEWEAIQKATAHFRELDLLGGLIYIDRKPCAMTMASIIRQELYDIHFEKSLPNVDNIYPVLSREMAKSLSDAQLFNREEDLNLEGLRQAKLSWFPVFILEKYTAQLKSN